VPNLVIPDEAKINWAQAQIDDLPTLSDCYVRLISGAVAIDQYTTLAELEAVQSSFEGYMPQQLLNWSDAVIIGADAMTEADIVTFAATADSDDTIVGYYVTNASGTKMWGAATFAEALPVPFDADLEIDTTVNLGSIFSL